jgi:hypothetical protein
VPYDAPLEHFRDGLRRSATIDGFGLCEILLAGH